MKKLLQLTLLSSSLLFIFSCSGDGEALPPESSALQQTWQLKTMSVYDSNDCASGELFSVSAAADGSIILPDANTCTNLELLLDATGFCPADPANLPMDAMLYMQLTSTDSLATEAGGYYQKTMYGVLPNGLKYDVDYSTHGRFYTYGNKMETQLLATIEDDEVGVTNSRVASVALTNPKEYQYSAGTSVLTMKHFDADFDTDGDNDCMVMRYSLAASYNLRGCVDSLAVNYFGADQNDFMIAAKEEDGSCTYSADEAGQSCTMIAQVDDDFNGEYSVDETKVSVGIIDCTGTCMEMGQTAWQGDTVCDNGVNFSFECEAFSWDSWDCACASECKANYDTTAGTASVLGNSDGTNQIGEGNDILTTYTDANCQAACNVEDCGYDIGDLNDTSTWDCCPATCIQTAGASVACNDDCNIGACNWFRNTATNVAADIGLCCDQTGPDATAGTADDIDCSTAGLGGDGTCDQECNSGACNFDGGDCD